MRYDCFIPHSKPWITDEDIMTVNEVLASKMLARGNKVTEFEDAINNYLGGAGTIITGSGTAALVLALRTLDINKGDEVILPTYVCKSVANAVLAVGATPVFCDVGESWAMTPENVSPFLSRRTKAIIVVHIFGIACNTESFNDFKIPIIEDCCQAFGAKYNKKKVGTTGFAGVFSFHATKCLSTGEGGAVTFKESSFLKKGRYLLNHAYIPSPMSDLQAALGLSQFNRYNDFLKLRQEVADNYFNNIITVTTSATNSLKGKSIFYRYPIRFANRNIFDEIQKCYEKKGIAVRRGVDELLHRRFGIADRDFPNAVRCFEETISIPIYPSLTKSEQLWVIEKTNSILREKGVSMCG